MDTKTLSIGDFHAFGMDNVSRHGSYYKDDVDRANVASMLIDGWDYAKGGMPIVYKLSSDEQKTAVSEIESRRADIEAGRVAEIDVRVGDVKLKASSVELLHAYEGLYYSKGKPIAPKYGLVTCYRRTGVLPLVNATIARAKSADLSPITALMVTVKDYPAGETGRLERMADNVRENEGKDIGRRKLGNVEKLQAGYYMFQAGATQSLLRKTFKDGQGQDLWWFLKLNRKFEHLNIVPDMLAGKIDVGSYRRKITQKIVEDGKIIIDKEGNTVDATDDRILAYVKNPSGTNGVAPTPASHAELVAKVETCPVKLVRFVLNAAAKKDLDRINKLLPVADELNAAIQPLIVKAGIADEVNSL